MGKRLWQKNKQNSQDIEESLNSLGMGHHIQNCKTRRGKTRFFTDRKIHNCLVKRLKEAHKYKSAGKPAEARSEWNFE